jgi:hypothetical protein
VLLPPDTVTVVVDVSVDLDVTRRVNPAFALEMLPNRDSLPYAEKYGIPDVQSMFRGTLRYEVC